LLYVCPSRALARPRRARSGRLSRRRVRGGPQAPLRGLDGIGRELDHPPLSLAYLVGLARRDHEQVARGDVPRLGPYSLPPAAPLEEGDREELVAVRPREDHLVVPVEPLDSYARGIRTQARARRWDACVSSPCPSIVPPRPKWFSMFCAADRTLPWRFGRGCQTRSMAPSSRDR
jgi:hypothetical protein